MIDMSYCNLAVAVLLYVEYTRFSMATCRLASMMPAQTQNCCEGSQIHNSWSGLGVDSHSQKGKTRCRNMPAPFTQPCVNNSKARNFCIL